MYLLACSVLKGVFKRSTFTEKFSKKLCAPLFDYSFAVVSLYFELYVAKSMRYRP